MPTDLKGYRVFIASPSGLSKERKVFRDTLAAYNEMDAVARGAMFIPVGWEQTLGGVGRPQSLINEDIETCDYFVLVLHNRWGSPPDAEIDGEYTSGTEEEYELALKLFKDTKSPMRQLVVSFKGVDPSQLADPGPQLSKVIEFKKKIEREKKLLFHQFDTDEEFSKRLREHLAQWVRDHEEGVQTKVTAREALPIAAAPMRIADPASEPPGDGAPSAVSAKLEEARKLADDGQLTEAEVRFASVIITGDSPEAYWRYGNFLDRIGRLALAKVMYERMFEVASGQDEPTWAALALVNLGNLFMTNANIVEAERMYSTSLDIAQRHANELGIADASGSLGLIFRAKGNLGKAEEYHRTALEIHERLDSVGDLASDYGNLGLVYFEKGHLDQAEAYVRKALEFEKKLGRLEATANHYGNLGLIYGAKGDLEKAEQHLRKSLEVNLKLERLEGIANQYASLGKVQELRGDVDDARTSWTKARDLYARIPIPKKVVQVQSWIDGQRKGSK